jgi:hypothetical protein
VLWIAANRINERFKLGFDDRLAHQRPTERAPKLPRGSWSTKRVRTRSK